MCQSLFIAPPTLTQEFHRLSNPSFNASSVAAPSSALLPSQVADKKILLAPPLKLQVSYNEAISSGSSFKEVQWVNEQINEEDEEELEVVACQASSDNNDKVGNDNPHDDDKDPSATKDVDEDEQGEDVIDSGKREKARLKKM
ncbi:uncharacterized protein [Arachis hypogaea]|uniref:uncharacterized protein n=1 Tax=Arachis hypogaea TaxID=3818 RepID=UPI003B214ED4